MRLRLLLGFLIVLSSSTFSQYSYLWVSHPQKWLSGTGTIESAVWVVRPKGNIAQCDLYMTYSARGLGFSQADSFEVYHNISLPDNAVVNDLWLWVGNDIMRALHLDVYTASSIYYGIVQWRRDPCLLVKSYSYYSGYSSYVARVYPLMGTGKRKIKVSYSIPINWTANGPLIEIPRGLLTASRTTPPMRIRVIPDTAWQRPRVMELTKNPFVIVEDNVTGPVYQCDLSGALVASASRLTLTFDKELNGGFLFQQHSRNGDNYYHMAIVPGLVFPVGKTRRVAVLLDLDSAAANLGTSVFVTHMKSFMLSRFSERDSFNIFYNSVIGERRASETWFKGGVEGVNAAFDSIKAAGGPRYKRGAASVSGLLEMGLDFVHQAGGEGSVLLVTSSTECLDYRWANKVLEVVRPWLNYRIPVNVAEFAYPWNRYLYLDGQYWYANQYFDKNIAQATGGAYFNEYDWSNPAAALDRVLEKMEPYLQPPPEAFDMTVTPAGGLTYQRCKPFGVAASAPSWSRSIQENGKFAGGPPFTVNLSALYKGQVYLKTLTVDASSANSSDSTLVQHWAGNYIAQLEANSSSGLTPTEILKLSLENRVLSKYSAFLALEPNDTLKACLTCKDESGPPLAVRMKQEPPSNDSLVQAYPNPFNSSTKISVHLPKGTKPEQVSVAIFNLLGQQVRTFDPGVLSSSSVHTYTWDGTNDHGNAVSSGVYFFRLSLPAKVVTARLLLSK